MTKQEKNLRRMQRDVRALLIALKREIGDEYRADEESTVPSMQVTIGASADASAWNYQSGDNSYTGGAYGFPYWGVVTLYRRSNSGELAADACAQIFDQLPETEG